MTPSRTLLTALITSCFTVVTAQTLPDIFDTVLVTYRLSPSQEAQFGGNDGAVTPFWAEWDAQNTPTLTRDYIQMDPAHCAPPGRDSYTGPQDNTLLVKAGWGVKGVYMLIEMIDDDFLDRQMGNADSLHRDVLELYIDTMSSAENRAGGGTVYIGLYESTLTYTSVQYVLSMGRDRVYTNFRMSYYDEILWSWQDTWPSFAAAAQLYDSLAFETVRLSATRRAQEWFLPWSSVGQGGPAAGMPSQGRRFAFAGGCHDMDSLQGDTICSLKWKNRGNPWAGRVDGQYNNTWGDLEMGPPLTTTAVVAGRLQAPASNRPSRLVRSTSPAWTLDGRVVAASAEVHAQGHCVLVVRDAAAGTPLRLVHP